MTYSMDEKYLEFVYVDHRPYTVWGGRWEKKISFKYDLIENDYLPDWCMPESSKLYTGLWRPADMNPNLYMYKYAVWQRTF